jgi:muconolactone D-isomerase
MEFLVRFKWTVPSGMPDDEWQAIRAAERAHGGEMMDQGKMVRLWRLPGQRGAIGLFAVVDATELDQILMAYPMNPYLDISVEPLAQHPLEAARSRRGDPGL